MAAAWSREASCDTCPMKIRAVSHSAQLAHGGILVAWVGHRKNREFGYTDCRNTTTHTWTNPLATGTLTGRGNLVTIKTVTSTMVSEMGTLPPPGAFSGLVINVCGSPPHKFAYLAKFLAMFIVAEGGVGEIGIVDAGWWCGWLTSEFETQAGIFFFLLGGRGGGREFQVQIL